MKAKFLWIKILQMSLARVVGVVKIECISNIYLMDTDKRVPRSPIPFVYWFCLENLEQ